MLAAEIWHWWIGVAMLAGGILVCVALIGGYVWQVSSQRHPGGKRQREQEL